MRRARVIGRLAFAVAGLAVLLLAANRWEEPGLHPVSPEATARHEPLPARHAARLSEPELQEMLLLVGVMQRLNG